MNTSSARIILLNVIVLAALASGCRGNKEESHNYPTEVRDVAEALLNDSAHAFASAVSYPLDRPYPLHSIVDSASMVDYYPTMVDDSLRQVISLAPDSLWVSDGWRGWTFDSGEYFHIDSGKIYEMDYLSKGERYLLDSLRREEIASLSPDMRRGWLPVTCAVDTSAATVFRIDRYLHGSDTIAPDEPVYRLAIYRIARLDSAPSRMLYGIYDPEGSMGSRLYHFADSAGVTADYSPDFLEEDEPTMEINDNGKVSRYHARRGYWLDMVRPATESPLRHASRDRGQRLGVTPAEGYLPGLIQHTQLPATDHVEVDSAQQ